MSNLLHTPKKGLGLTLPSPDVTDASYRAVFDTMFVGFAAPDKSFFGITFDNVLISVSELSNVTVSRSLLTGIISIVSTLINVRKGS